MSGGVEARRAVGGVDGVREKAPVCLMNFSKALIPLGVPRISERTMSLETSRRIPR